MRLGGEDSLSGPEPARDGLLPEPVSVDCKSRVVSTSLWSYTAERKAWLLWALLPWQLQKAALQALRRGLTGAELGQCLHVRTEKKEKRRSWFMRCLAGPTYTDQAPSPARWGMRAPGMRPISLHHVCFYYGEECNRVASFPYFILASVWSAGMKAEGAHASLNNYFFKAHKLAYSFIVKISF